MVHLLDAIVADLCIPLCMSVGGEKKSKKDFGGFLTPEIVSYGSDGLIKRRTGYDTHANMQAPRVSMRYLLASLAIHHTKLTRSEALIRVAHSFDLSCQYIGGYPLNAVDS